MELSQLFRDSVDWPRHLRNAVKDLNLMCCLICMSLPGRNLLTPFKALWVLFVHGLIVYLATATLATFDSKGQVPVLFAFELVLHFLL